MCTCSYTLDEFKEEGGDVPEKWRDKETKQRQIWRISTPSVPAPLANALLATPPRACPYCEDCVLFSRMEKNRLDFVFTLFKIRKFNNQAGWKKTRWVRLILVVDARTSLPNFHSLFSLMRAIIVVINQSFSSQNTLFGEWNVSDWNENKNKQQTQKQSKIWCKNRWWNEKKLQVEEGLVTLTYAWNLCFFEKKPENPRKQRDTS